MRFQNPLFIDIIWDRFYNGPNQRGHQNPIIPHLNRTFICLVATALHRALLAWESGVWRSTEQFRESNVIVKNTFIRHLSTWGALPQENRDALITLYQKKLSLRLAVAGYLTVEVPVAAVSDPDHLTIFVARYPHSRLCRPNI
jgi:hypothetical protein